MEIFFVSPGLLYSSDYPFEMAGSESVIYGVSKELASKGHEIYISGRFSDMREDQIKKDEVNFVNIKSRDFRDRKIHELLSVMSYSKFTSNIIKKINPDIISLNDRFSAYYPSKLNNKKIFTTHNPDAMDFYKNYSFDRNQLNRFLFPIKHVVENKVLHNSDEIIALNKSISSYLFAEGFDNVSIIPNAIDSSLYQNTGDENYILYAGRLDRVKGIKYLIKAFYELLEFTDYNLFIIGSGSDEIRLKKMVSFYKIENRVKFIPMVKKEILREYLAKCSIFVFPSLYETMGIVLLEAMASGKPVVASDIPGPQDIIAHGHDGYLFNKCNINELKRYLKMLIEDENLRNRFGINAKKTVENKFDFKIIANEYLNVFKEIM